MVLAKSNGDQPRNRKTYSGLFVARLQHDISTQNAVFNRAFHGLYPLVLHGWSPPIERSVLCLYPGNHGQAKKL